jgi:DnaB-like helicase C terminal domain
MSVYDQFSAEMDRGMEGSNEGLSIGLPRASKYIGMRRGLYTVIVSGTGMGKSSMLHHNYILTPYEHFREGKTKMKFKCFLFSMERPKVYLIAKWLCRKIFMDQGILIPVAKMLGWWDVKLTMDEKNLIHHFRSYIEEMMEYVEIIDGAHNPTHIYKIVKKYAETTGRFEEVDEYNKVYIPNDPNLIVEVALDTYGLLKKEERLPTKKDAIEKQSEYFQWFRDALGYFCVGISQINRDLASPILMKMGDVEPSMETIKESGRPAEDADIVISMFDPLRYDISKLLEKDKIGHSPYKMEDQQTGARHYRRIKILKNTYGESDVAIGACMHGSTGIVKELPWPKDMTDDHYKQIISGQYYL